MKIQLLLLPLMHMICFCHGIGYSYTRFMGPVTGPEQKLFIKNEHTGIGTVDYVGYPKYQFSYGIEDAEQRMLQNRKETRDGDNVQGIYSVVDPDGALRVVKYTADDVNGFQAEVLRNGVSSLHGNNYLNDNRQNVNNGYWQEARVPHEAAVEENSHEDDEYTSSESHNNEYDDNDDDDNKSYENDEHDEAQEQDGSSEEEEEYEHAEENEDDSYE